MSIQSAMAPLKERFDALQSSEQRAVTILGVFAVVVVTYLGIWAPASDWRVIAEQARDRQFDTLSMMKETESQARAAARERPAETAEGSLLSLVSSSAQAQGINPNRLQPEGENAVSLWFDNVAFSSVMELLERMAAIPGVEVQQLVIDGSEEPGQVRARIVLSR